MQICSKIEIPIKNKTLFFEKVEIFQTFLDVENFGTIKIQAPFGYLFCQKLTKRNILISRPILGELGTGLKNQKCIGMSQTY